MEQQPEQFNNSSLLRLFSAASVFVPVISTDASNSIKKETVAQLFSCEFCKIFKGFLKSCLIEHFQTSASEFWVGELEEFSLAKMLINRFS